MNRQPGSGPLASPERGEEEWFSDTTGGAVGAVGDLIAELEYGQHLGPIWPVYQDEQSGPALEPGETVLAGFFCPVEQVNSVGGSGFVHAWKLPSPFSVTLTDRRLIYGCTDFTKGGRWVGFGVGGAVIAGTAMAVSAIRAKQRRAGRIAAGHVRHEWVANAGLMSLQNRPRGAAPNTFVVTVGFAGSRQFLRLNAGSFDEQFVRYYAGLVSHHRLYSGAALGDAERQQLEATAAQTTAGEWYGDTFKFEIPAAIDVPWFAPQAEAAPTPPPLGP